MFRTAMKKITIEIASDKVLDQLQEGNPQNARKMLGTIQDPAAAKENLNPRSLKPVEHVAKKRKMTDQSVQTTMEEARGVTADDLTAESPGEDYWRLLAAKRAVSLDESLKENEKLKDHVVLLKEENKVCKDLLNESHCLIAVLKDLLNEEDDEDQGDDEDQDDDEESSSEATEED